ncbi:2-isopropylmalate synthase [Candidatus Acetothermia bacterium]|nr:2-isopropylmalate synthase [Candidatus Acetothermia bacterium]
MSNAFRANELIYDWNALKAPKKPKKIELNDETLRDGLQSPSITDPSIEQKIKALHLMAELGVAAANIGMPTGSRSKQDAIALAREIARHKLNIRPNCAARTAIPDVTAVIEVSQAAGISVEASTFLGSSGIRKLAEGWDLDVMRKHTETAVKLAVQNKLPVMFVTEDTTRAHPQTLKKLYRTALDCGAYRITLADTVGHATPLGVKNLIRFVKTEVVKGYENVQIDWHGHNDRGLALANSLAAFEAGAHCVHGTILGIGERVGNTALDQLLVNLKLLDWIDNDLRKLPEYVELVAKYCNGPLPFNYPVMGRDAFRTSTGVHAAAIVKAKQKGDDFLANRIYSGVPSDLFGRNQEIEIGPASGHHNVEFWLHSRGIKPTPQMIEAILQRAKQSRTVLSEEELQRVVEMK